MLKGNSSYPNRYNVAVKIKQEKYNSKYFNIILYNSKFSYKYLPKPKFIMKVIFWILTSPTSAGSMDNTGHNNYVVL